MEDTLRSLFLKLQDVVHCRCVNSVTKEGAKNFLTAPGDLAISQEDKNTFKSLLSHVEETTLKPWSDNQAEFLVLSRFEDDNLNPVNYMSVLSSFGFAQGDKTSLEMVKSYIKKHCDQCYPNAPLLMNNLGVMFSENALYEESQDCFNMAKLYCQHQDNIKDAVITLNQAVLKKTLGKYKEAANLATTAASLCHDISMRTTNYAQLPVKLLGRVADMLQEFGNHQMLKKILRTAVHFDIPGADKAVTTVLSRQLMKIQLERMDQKIEAREVKDFISRLLSFLAKPDPSKISMDAELLRIFINAAKLCRSIGQCKEASELLKKLRSIFLLVHGENSFLHGLLLYQMGSFLHGSGRFNDAETALKQAEGILFCHCGENHHSVALCRSVLGSCILLKGNAKDAFDYLNKALTVFKKLNPIHPEVGEITLKFAFFYADERNFQQAQETLQEAEAIFKLSCGEVSCKTASTYFQVGMILQRFKQFRLSAVEKIQKGIDVMLNLGMSLNHSDVMFWSSFLGVLKHSLGMVKEAEKCFIDVQNNVPICDYVGSKETEILTSEDWFLHYRDTADDRRSRSSFVKAQVISLVNLVHMKGCDKRIQYLDKLVCCVTEEEIDEINVRDFAGQDVFLFTHKIPSFNRPAVLIIHVFDSLSDRLEADDDIDSKMFLSSSGEKSPFTLFWRIQSRGLDIKEINCLAASFRESVKMLFLQPKFRKGFKEGKDLYLELPGSADSSSFSSHLDRLPLLVELELTKSQEQCDDFDYLTSWQSSVDFAVHSVPHVSYFSFTCVNQRETEFVFDHLSQNLGQNLALKGFQEDVQVICDVTPEENVARFIFQESQNLFLTVVVRNLSVIVKCCSVKESDANCLCSSVRNALTVTIESLLEIASINLETSMLLDCEGIGSVLGHEEYLNGNCSQSVNCNPVGCSLTLESGNSTITDRESKTASNSTRKLRVTLLSSEWSSTKGGLSTINRELAIQLAKHPSVEVSVYLPQCSEEDKQVAASHSVHLMKAKEMPGYDPVDWLSFLPEHHAVDCVVGHGAVLGRQVQFIKRNHNCKWVQVVHTSPEEIGMYKGYGKHISQGEEKHQVEVELCKLADQVVAVGPKLFEEYSGYLRACGRDQNVFSLTPGVFSEFADVRHANEERRTFRVVVFAHGDNEEFQLKGYDIAAGAFAELKDEPQHYKLLFVGAPSGKEERVQDLLLNYGIDRSQLTVRCFNGSREQLAQLFCEVDLAIMPSRTEGFGLAALEALSAGLPVLVSGNSGLGQALKKVQYGSSCVVDSEDPKDWASAIKAVRHKDRDMRLLESRILSETYAKMYNWQDQCNRLIETMLHITQSSSKGLHPLKKDKRTTLLQPWRRAIPLVTQAQNVDESSGRSLTHHSEAHEFLEDRGTHPWCQPLESPICLENPDVIHPLGYPHDKFHYVDVGLCLVEYLLNHSRPVSYGEKGLNSCGTWSTDVVVCGSDISDDSSLSSSLIFSSATSSSLNSVPTTASTVPLADYNHFTSTKSPCESLSSVDKKCKADPSSDVIYVGESREHLSDDPLRITKCSRLSVNLPKEPSLSVDACAFSQSSYEECLNVEQSCGHPETRETKPSKTFTVENINGAEEVVISSTDQKAAVQNISSKDKDSSIGNDIKLLTTQCVEDLCANQSSKVEGPQQSIHGPLSEASLDKVDTGAATEDFFRTLLANLEDELAASQKDRYELEQQIRKLEERLKQSEEEKRELQADLGRYLFLEEKEKRRGRLLGGATSVQEPGLLLHSRLLEISNSLSSAEVKKIKLLLKSKVNGFRLARISEAFELFEELETNGLFSLNYVGQLLDGIQRYDLVKKLGIHAPLPRSRKGSNSSVESDHASNSAKSAPVQDNILDEQTDGPEMKMQMDYAPSSKNSFELTGSDENGISLRAEEIDHGQSQCSSILSSGSSFEEDGDIHLSNKSVENVVLVEESPKSPIPSDVMFRSNSSRSSSDLSANSDKTAPAMSNSILQASFEVDGFQVMSDGSQSTSGYSDPNLTTWDSQGISHVMARPSNELADEDGQLRGACTANGEERVVESHDFCDGAIMTVPYSTKTITECTKTDSLISSDSSLARTQSIANGGSVSSTQQQVFSDGESQTTPPSSDATDWKRQGARPKETQHTVVEQVPKEPVVYITDGLAGDFLARHTQDKSLHDSIYQTDVGSFFNDFPSQRTSFSGGDISQFSRAQAYFGDCQVASGTEPFIATGNSFVSGSSRHLGGPSNAEPFSDNSGLSPGRVGNDLFSLHSDYLSRNTSTGANNYSLQSDFVHNSSRFAGVDHFDGQTYLPSAQQAPYPPISSEDPVLNRNLGMTCSSFADPSWTGAAQTLPGDPVYNAPRFSSFSSEQLTGSVHDANRFTGDDEASAFISNQGSDEPAQKPNLTLGNSRTTTANIADDANSAARYQLGNSTTFDGVLAARSTHDTSVLEPRLGDTDNNRVSVLNNTDFGTDSIEASDNSLLALERRVAEACALVERVLREREEREQFGREIERKEQLIREQRARERREREERELREAENWPQQQEAINARSQWLCEHYQRHCRVRFPCCTQFYPCHRCHNISKACDNEEAKACHATHLKCSHCQHEQEIGEDSAKCRKCGGKMSAYFCAICKHFTSVDKNPYHCEKCGICRIHQDKSFHCEVCNVCLDKRLEGNHKCRPDSGHDECCICLEDAFSGCQILPCSHKVHRECAIAMIQNGIRTCPICRHPLYSQSSRE